MSLKHSLIRTNTEVLTNFLMRLFYKSSDLPLFIKICKTVFKLFLVANEKSYILRDIQNNFPVKNKCFLIYNVQ